MATRDGVRETWRSPLQAVRICLRPWARRRTLTTAAIVGVVLSLINQGGVLLAGQATAATWVRVGLNFVVPFVVSSVGVLIATRADDVVVPEQGAEGSPEESSRQNPP